MHSRSSPSKSTSARASRIRQKQHSNEDLELLAAAAAEAVTPSTNNNDTHAWARQVVDSVQALQVPPKLGRLLGHNDTDNEPLLLITGLDQVVFENLSVASACRIAGYKPLPYLCYMLSGMVCDVLMFLFDLFLHFGLGLQNATLCWSIGFVTSIVPRHTALKVMCFGNYVGGYYQSLARMYAGMSATIVLSTVFNYIMTMYLGVAHYVAWIFTLIWTGIVNYFILKTLWTFGDDKNATKANE